MTDTWATRLSSVARFTSDRAEVATNRVFPFCIASINNLLTTLRHPYTDQCTQLPFPRLPAHLSQLYIRRHPISKMILFSTQRQTLLVSVQAKEIVNKTEHVPAKKMVSRFFR